MAGGQCGAGDPAAAQVATEKVSEAVAAPDEFAKCLGEVGNHFASLEYFVEQFVRHCPAKPLTSTGASAASAAQSGTC